MFSCIAFYLYFFPTHIDIGLLFSYHKIMKFKRTKDKKAGSFIKSVKAGTKGYFQKSAKNVCRLTDVFGEHKAVGYIGFLLQPVVAIGQVVFGYHFLFTLGYIALYNAWLLKTAKKKSEDK